MRQSIPLEHVAIPLERVDRAIEYASSLRAGQNTPHRRIERAINVEDRRYTEIWVSYLYPELPLSAEFPPNREALGREALARRSVPRVVDCAIDTIAHRSRC
jgi:hypothetical protein